EELDLDRPIFERYIGWLGDTVTGDLGTSLVPPVQDVSDMVASRLPVTIEIAVLAMVMSLAIAVPLALRSAHRPGDPFDRIATAGAFGAISIPSFLGGLLLIFFFVFHRGIVQAGVVTAVALWLVMHVVRSAATVRYYPPGASRRRYALGRAVVAVAIAGLGVLLLLRFPSFPRQGFVRLGSGEGII